MLKGADKEPKPIGDHKEKETVAKIKIVGGATATDTNLANSQENSFLSEWLQFAVFWFSIG